MSTPPDHPAPERTRTRPRGAVALTLTAIGVTAAVVIGLLIATNVFTDEERLVEGVEQELTEGPFYALPTPAPTGAPGTLVRSEQIANAPEGSTAWRILYHSRDLTGADILVSGTVIAPDTSGTDATATDRPIVSWAHPTTGVAARCAPSVGVDPFDLIEGLDALLDAGYVVAATDYSGMGAAGPNAYLIGETEGNNVLDAARAARELTDAGAGDELVLWGHSQGGQAALFAAQQAADYAPELDLRAVAAAAPATDLAALLDDDINGVSGVTLGAYAFGAYAEVYGPTVEGAELDTILTPAGVAAVAPLSDLCLLGQNTELHKMATPLVGGFVKADPATTAPWSELLAANTPGAPSGAAPIDVPVFIAQGDTDKLVHPEVTAHFVDTERARGVEITYATIPDTGHGLVADRAMPTLLGWLADHGLPGGP